MRDLDLQVNKEGVKKLVYMRAAWERFKKCRNNNYDFFDHDHPAFLTVKERECYLDKIFRIIFDFND